MEPLLRSTAGSEEFLAQAARRKARPARTGLRRRMDDTSGEAICASRGRAAWYKKIMIL
jgi:hypothetical protein